MNVEEEISIDALKPNDTVIIKPGTRIPVDGVVLKGNSFVDQSSITGESLPVEKVEGNEIFAGTMNKSGVLEVEAHRVSKETIFGKIVEIIEQAERSKAPIQKVADILSARLVYFAFGGAILTFLVTHNIVSAICGAHCCRSVRSCRRNAACRSRGYRSHSQGRNHRQGGCLS